MKIYSIFDDFTLEAVEILEKSGVEVTVHPLGVSRPDHNQMKEIIDHYDGIIIGTSQKISEDMLNGVDSPRIIATASVGIDHINIPVEKKNLITVINTPKANATSVAEYTIGCALMCVKRVYEGKALYISGQDNKKLRRKPEDLCGKTLGVIGAGAISRKIIEYAQFFGMNVLCWTKHPENHRDITELGASFDTLEHLISASDILSVNLPNNDGTKNIISDKIVSMMKEDAIFISVSRRESVDYKALFNKAMKYSSFYVCLDLDVNDSVLSSLNNRDNIIVTPHIAGGTVETRKRMFREVAERVADQIKMNL